MFYYRYCQLILDLILSTSNVCLLAICDDYFERSKCLRVNSEEFGRDRRSLRKRIPF